MTSAFRVDGLISGINTTDLVNSLMALERRPLLQLMQQQKSIETRQQALSAIKTKLISLQSALSSLTLQSSVRAKTATTDTPSSSTPKISVSASSEAALGSFKVSVTQLATSTTITNNGYLGRAIETNVPLASAGFAIEPNTDEARYFTITTVSGGVTTSQKIYIDSDTVLSDGVDDFGANTIIAKIRDAGLGLTATIENDAEGRPNRLKISAGAGVDIRLGAGGDTSNFLTVAKLKDAVQNGTSIESTGNLGALVPTQSLSDARFKTALSGLDASGSGSFKINGVEITYSQSESLNAILSRINSSTAGVTASYDPILDQVRLTANATGNSTIALEDTVGNFLEVLGLIDSNGDVVGTQVVGQNAIYRISTVNNGMDLTSASNTISGILPGVTINLLDVTTSDVTVTISQDKNTTISAIRSFVSAFNSALSTLRDATKYDTTTKQAGVLFGDSTVVGITQRLQRLVSERAIGVTGPYRSLADIGISFGAVGSSPSSATELTIDEAKLNRALTEAPEAVAQLLAGFQTTATLDGATGQISGFTGMATTHVSGTYTIVSSGEDGTDNLTVIFTPKDGTPGEATKHTLRVDGKNSTAVPGLVLSGKSFAEAGTQEITVTVTTLGVMHMFNDYLNEITGSSGPFATRQESANEELTRLSRRIAEVEDRLAEKEQALYRRYAMLEATLAQLQRQNASLLSAIAALPSQSTSK